MEATNWTIKEKPMEAYSVDNSAGTRTDKATFDELKEAMSDDLYWVRFFARPCCPAPDLESAAEMLDRLIGEVAARNDLIASEKDELASMIESRKQWYASSGLCRGSRHQV